MSNQNISTGSKVDIELTEEQLDQLRPYETFVQQRARGGNPVALMAQVEPNQFRMRVIVIDNETTRKIQDVMQAAGYLSEEARLHFDAKLQELADLYSFAPQNAEQLTNTGALA